MSNNKFLASSEVAQPPYAQRRDRVMQLLTERGGETIDHLNGSLLDHLARTEELLLGWGCTDTVVLAGLCHATYGTDGFERVLLGLEERAVLCGAVGDDVEALVYLYASCDRGFTYQRLGHGHLPSFKDRFQDRVFRPAEGQLQDFVDLTLANEFDVGVLGTSSTEIPQWFVSMYSHLQHLASESVRRGLQCLDGVSG